MKKKIYIHIYKVTWVTIYTLLHILSPVSNRKNRKNNLERQKPRKKQGNEGWPVLFWLCRVEITVFVECATVQHPKRKKCTV